MTDTKTPLRIAIGNTSGDMDSIVGALGLAYYLTLKTKQLWTPVVNCAAADLALKAEIYCHLVQDCKIKQDSMLYFDELAKCGEIAEIALIDHNVIAAEQADALGKDCHKKVTYVYDHHVDTKTYPLEQLKDYQVRFIGSACSMLVLMMKENHGLFDPQLFIRWVDRPNYAYLLGAAVILDSHNFAEDMRDSKWSSEDEVARDHLNKFTSLNEEYYDRMELNKHDAKLALTLGFQGNLRRDYKQYRLMKNGQPGTMGIPVMVCDLDDMFNEWGHDQVCKEICEHMTEQTLSMFGIHFNILNTSTNIVERTIFVFTKNDCDFGKSYEDFLTACQASDLLKCSKDVRRGTYK